MPYSPMQKHCIQMKDHKGKTTGIMMEGSAMHMSMLHKETEEQEAKNYLDDTPVQDKASAMEMSPYKMDHGSPAEFTGMSGGSALHQIDEKDGVIVTGDASRIGGKTTMTEAEKRAEKKKRLQEKREIQRANIQMKKELAKETSRAKRAAHEVKLQQIKRKKEGKDYIDTKTGKVVRRS